MKAEGFFFFLLNWRTTKNKNKKEKRTGECMERANRQVDVGGAGAGATWVGETFHEKTQERMTVSLYIERVAFFIFHQPRFVILFVLVVECLALCLLLPGNA